MRSESYAQPESLIGHNRAPVDAQTIVADLADEFDHLKRRRDELLAAEQRIPPIESDETAQKVTDFIRQLSAVAKAADTSRIGAKEPYLEGGRAVDGYFKSLIDPLLSSKKRVESALTNYLRRKEAEERRKREEEQRLAREEEARQRREAEEAAAKIRDEQSLQDAIAKEQAAKLASADADKADKAAVAKPAELSRTRGEYGAVSSLRTDWVFADVEREELDLEALRYHLPSDGIEKAIRSFIKAGGRSLRGARIFESTSAVVR